MSPLTGFTPSAVNPAPDATFYVIRDDLDGYRKVTSDLNPSKVPCLLSMVDRIEEATWFPHYSDAAVVIARREERYGFPGSFFRIVRVTRTTSPGKTVRRVLDHGEAAPAGATIKFAAMNPYRPLTNEAGTQLEPAELRLWDNEAAISLSAYRREMPSVSNYVVRRVALITTEPTVEYKEEVVS